MIWSARKQYYHSLEAFSQLKSVYLLKKTDVKVKGLYSYSNYAQCILGNF